MQVPQWIQAILYTGGFIFLMLYINFVMSWERFGMRMLGWLIFG